MERFWKNRRGALTVEFALNVALFVAVFVMSFEVCRVQVVGMLLERCVSDIAYQSRVVAGENFGGIARRVLNRRSNSLFSADDVRVRARHASDFALLRNSGGIAGAGGSGDAVHITLEAEIGIFTNLVPSPWKMTRTIEYYYLNEHTQAGGRAGRQGK